MLSYLRKWYDKIILRKYHIRYLEMKRMQPYFIHWYHTFLKYYNNRMKIKKLQIKIMKRIAYSILLTWKLYTIRSKRLNELFHYQEQLTLYNKKKKIWNKWIEVKLNNKFYFLYKIVEKRTYLYLKLRFLKKWKKSYYQSIVLNKKLLKVIFHAWKNLIRDNKLEEYANDKALLHYYIFSGKWALKLWFWKTQRKKNLRNKSLRAMNLLLIKKSKLMLQYWRLRCWRLGRRVLYGKNKYVQNNNINHNNNHNNNYQNINNDRYNRNSSNYNNYNQSPRSSSQQYHIGLNSSSKPMLTTTTTTTTKSSSLSPTKNKKSQLTTPLEVGYDTPLRISTLNNEHYLHTPRFNSTLNSPYSTTFRTNNIQDNNFLTTPRDNRLLSKYSMISTIQSQPSPSSSFHYSQRGINSYKYHLTNNNNNLLIHGRTPLAHEAAQLWALRRWKRYVYYYYFINLYLYIYFF